MAFIQTISQAFPSHLDRQEKVKLGKLYHTSRDFIFDCLTSNAISSPYINYDSKCRKINDYGYTTLCKNVRQRICKDVPETRVRIIYESICKLMNSRQES